VVTAFCAKSEAFPDRPALGLFAWMNQLLVGIASSRALMGALVSEAEHSKEDEAKNFATVAHGLTLEMEEMFDLKIAWPEFDFLYHGLRRRLGLEGMYLRTRRRLRELAVHANVVSQHRVFEAQKADLEVQKSQTERLATLQRWGGLLAIGIILVGVLGTFSSQRSGYWGWGALAVLAFVVMASLVIPKKFPRLFRAATNHRPSDSDSS